MQYRKISDLHKLDNNPRCIKEDDMQRLITSIRNNPKHFEGRPVLLSNRTGKLVIIAGNMRYEASKIIGLTEIPTFLIENLTEEQEREIIIRDNVNNGDWDYELLANDWDYDDLLDWGVELPALDIDDDLDDVSDFEDKEDNSLITKYRIIIECDDEMHCAKLDNEFKQRKLKHKAESYE